MGFKNYRTAPELFGPLHEQFRFTIDVAASHANALLPVYCTPDGKFRRVSTAPLQANVITAFQDGLNPKSWEGERVWCNPPYDHALGRWVDLANRGIAEMSVLLLPPSIDTAWFHSLFLMGHTSASVRRRPYYTAIEFEEGWKAGAREVRFLAGRIPFLLPKDGDEGEVLSVPTKTPRAGNLIVITWGRR